MGNPYKDLLKTIHIAEKSKTVGEKFIADLNRSIQLSKPKHTPSKTVKPSSLGGCFRNQYFMLQGYESDVGSLEKAESITIQQSGTDRHDRIQNAVQSAKDFSIDITWCDPEEEARLAQSKGINTEIKRRDGNELLCHNSDYNANFKCDGIIIYNGIKHILEIKTEEFFKFNSRIGPEPNHEYQAVMYCLCFGIDHVMFVYEDRNLTNRKAYQVSVDENLKNTIKDRIAHILMYSEKKKVPPKEKGKCTYCNYKQACKKAGNTQSYSYDELKEMKVDDEIESKENRS